MQPASWLCTQAGHTQALFSKCKSGQDPGLQSKRALVALNTNDCVAAIMGARLSATPYVTCTGIVFLVASGGCMADA